MVVAEDQASSIQLDTNLGTNVEPPPEAGWRETSSFDEVLFSSRSQCWRCGRIITQAGRLVGVHGRWWPYYGSWFQVYWDMALRPLKRDRCELYFHKPLGSKDFLCLSYVHSGARTSLSSFYLATLVLDEIARVKGSKAIVCNVTNHRISDRLMERWGWQAHCQKWRGRHFIKRFYGHYPKIAPYWRSRLTIDNDYGIAFGDPAATSNDADRS